MTDKEGIWGSRGLWDIRDSFVRVSEWWPLGGATA